MEQYLSVQRHFPKAHRGPRELPDHCRRQTQCTLHDSTQASPLGIRWFHGADPTSLSRAIKAWSAPPSADPRSWCKSFTKEKWQSSLTVIFRPLAPGRILTLHPSLAIPFPAPGRAAGDPFLLEKQVRVKVGEMRTGVVTLPRGFCDLQSLSLVLLEATALFSLRVVVLMTLCFDRSSGRTPAC